MLPLGQGCCRLGRGAALGCGSGPSPGGLDALGRCVAGGQFLVRPQADRLALGHQAGLLEPAVAGKKLVDGKPVAVRSAAADLLGLGAGQEPVDPAVAGKTLVFQPGIQFVDPLQNTLLFPMAVGKRVRDGQRAPPAGKLEVLIFQQVEVRPVVLNDPRREVAAPIPVCAVKLRRKLRFRVGMHLGPRPEHLQRLVGRADPGVAIQSGNHLAGSPL